MIVNCLYIGTLLIPFFVVHGMDSRVPKELLGVGLALFISLATFYEGKYKKFKNYWVLLFLGAVYVCILLAPSFTNFGLVYRHPPPSKAVSMLMNFNMSNYWEFKSFFYILLYSMTMIAIASIEFTKEQVKRLLFCMGLAALLTSLYIYIQALGFDPFFAKVNEGINPDVNYLDKPLIGGFMGQSTIVAPLIAMVIPITLFLKRYIWSALILFAVWLTSSKMAIIAIIIGVFYYLMLSKRKHHKAIFLGLLLSSLMLGYMFYDYQMSIPPWVEEYDDGNIHFKGRIKFDKFLSKETNGRFTAWSTAWKDLTEKYENQKRIAFGFGAGTFRFLFPIKNNSRFHQMHNDLFEMVYNFGIFGTSVFLIAVWFFLKQIFSNYTEFHHSLFTSFIVVVLCSLASFPFQIAPTIFYSVVILGLLQNETVGGYYSNS